MELGIVNEKENPLFSRKEIGFSVEAESVPSRAEIRESISKKFSVDLDAIKIKGIYGGFGSKNFKIEANVYKTKEDLEKVERKFKKDAKGEAVVEPESVAEEKSVNEVKPEAETPAGDSKEEVKESEAPKEEEKPSEEKEIGEEVKENINEE